MTSTLSVFSFALAVLFASTLYGDQRPAKPNVLLLLTDDLGWQDVKCYDIDEPSPTETPNIDSLAQRGVMFWQGYSPTPVCASSRCAIMSGNHAARSRKTSVVGGAPPHPLRTDSTMMDPWQSGRMPAEEITLPKVLRENGYVTGHSGKWHMAIQHHAFPQPIDQGFDFSRANRGSRSSMEDRLTGFATTAPNDPFRLDENGYPFHQTNEDAFDFLRENKDKPFFLYYATWLVHAPIHTRSEAHLDKYAERIGIAPAKVPGRETPGYVNPFYCAMVQELDYYVGQVFDYLDTTEDPRWPGHMLSENTFIIFSSDNGGMEGSPKERYTENFPLDRGKISAMEGGTRVPLIVTGPGIPAGVQTDVMANGLDFYPTILAMTGTQVPEGKQFDGCDLTPLLLGDPTDPSEVKQIDGSVRDTMMWHYPHGAAMESTIRVGDYKLIRNYDHVGHPHTQPLELYRLYETVDGKQTRVDIEEANNLTDSMPEKTEALNDRLTEILTEMDAAAPYYNPTTAADLPGKDQVCRVIKHTVRDDSAVFRYRENGAKVVAADLIFTRNGGERYEEWFREPARLLPNSRVEAAIPDGATHYVLNVIDENNFLVSYPPVKRSRTGYTSTAIKVEPPQ
ncbi:sulfatase [Allorhodopirellula solitaria]|uniref:Arylsulfatase n=1 Tax=Allorhodopirellula solitaria TaxID=2527987 RepID=A0A5C5YAY1_9BACT|nr:sulfatase [Allorhodopirellula solitaria]TWT72857.1 Arylsulfatase [Allorhodopirellula solitaria]